MPRAALRCHARQRAGYHRAADRQRGQRDTRGRVQRPVAACRLDRARRFPGVPLRPARDRRQRGHQSRVPPLGPRYRGRAARLPRNRSTGPARGGIRQLRCCQRPHAGRGRGMRCPGPQQPVDDRRKRRQHPAARGHPFALCTKTQESAGTCPASLRRCRPKETVARDGQGDAPAQHPLVARRPDEERARQLRRAGALPARRSRSHCASLCRALGCRR